MLTARKAAGRNPAAACADLARASGGRRAAQPFYLQMRGEANTVFAPPYYNRTAIAVVSLHDGSVQLLGPRKATRGQQMRLREGSVIENVCLAVPRFRHPCRRPGGFSVHARVNRRIRGPSVVGALHALASSSERGRSQQRGRHATADTAP